MMIDNIDYSFEDEVVTKFSYDTSVNRIEIQFEGYYEDENYVELPCSLIIENWQSAKSRIYGEKHYSSLEKYLGIFSMILSLESSSEKLELTVNTINNKYLELFFDQPKVRIKRIG